MIRCHVASSASTYVHHLSHLLGRRLVHICASVDVSVQKPDSPCRVFVLDRASFAQPGAICNGFQARPFVFTNFLQFARSRSCETSAPQWPANRISAVFSPFRTFMRPSGRSRFGEPINDDTRDGTNLRRNPLTPSSSRCHTDWCRAVRCSRRFVPAHR
jgi:hypothetical protein